MDIWSSNQEKALSHMRVERGVLASDFLRVAADLTEAQARISTLQTSFEAKKDEKKRLIRSWTEDDWK